MVYVLSQSKYLKSLMILVFFMTAIGVFHATAQEEPTVYGLTNVRVYYSYALGDQGYATVNLKYSIPKYVVVDKPVVIHAKISVSPVIKSFYIVFGVYAELCSDTIHLQSFTLWLDKYSREMDLEIVIPSLNLMKGCYNVTIYITPITAGGGSLNTIKIVSSDYSPAKVLLVKGNPFLNVMLPKNHIELYVNESKSLNITVEALNGSILLREIKIEPPPFIVAEPKITLPVYMEDGEKINISFDIRAVKAGAGIIALRIWYGTVFKEKYVDIYVPVIADYENILKVIHEYNITLNAYYNEINNIISNYGNTSEIKKGIEILYTLQEYLNKTLAQLSNEISNLKIEISNYENYTREKIKRQEDIIENISSYIDTIHHTLKSLYLNLSKINKTIENNHNTIKQLYEEQTNIKNTISFIKSTLTSINNSLKTLNKSISIEIDKVNRSINNSIKNIENNMKLLENDIKSLETKYQILKYIIVGITIAFTLSIITIVYYIKRY